ncbi:MAG TPA: phosphodiester glycosidase family protein [Kofleriaceae bacterium]|nr:phosphodiester glycosidase family protein [Kofleriaceae bacterium]
MSSKLSTKTTTPIAKPRRTYKRKLGLAALVLFGLMIGIGAASHIFPSFGAALADRVRAVVGPGPVAWAEDVTYGIEDRIKRLIYRDAPPKEFWDTPPAAPPRTAAMPPPTAPPPPAASLAAAPPSPTQSPAAPSVAPAPAFAPRSFQPPVPKVAGKSDGQWIAITDTDAPSEPPLFYKAIVHPDKIRSFAAVAVVAIDLSRVGLTLVPGTVEPVSSKLPAAQRTGLVPQDQLADLVAAFNGGFKAEHGHFGMMIDGVALLPPRDISCTIGLYKDGSLKIRTYPAIKDSEDDMRAYRQTPPCLVEDGKINNRLLTAENTVGWGAAVGGDTVIRRSAIGLDADGKTLFYGLGESVTADSLARAMLAAGAENAAQLDVNATYPRFLFYTHPENELPKAESALIPDIDFVKHEYVDRSEPRDFFFLTRKHATS